MTTPNPSPSSTAAERAPDFLYEPLLSPRLAAPRGRATSQDASPAAGTRGPAEPSPDFKPLLAPRVRSSGVRGLGGERDAESGASPSPRRSRSPEYKRGVERAAARGNAFAPAGCVECGSTAVVECRWFKRQFLDRRTKEGRLLSFAVVFVCTIFACGPIASWEIY